MTELRDLDKASAEAKTDGSGKGSDSDDTIPELEEAAGGGKAKQSRGEKKVRKFMSKLRLKPDEVNGLSTITDRSTNQTTCLTIPLQKRGSETKMPLSRYNATKIAKRKRQYKTLEENIGQSSTLLVTNRLKEKSLENLKLVVSKKRCLTVESDDLKSLKSVHTSIVSDSDKSFSEKLKCKKRTNKNKVGRKRKVPLVESDFESVSSISNQYRELRDRNNKAVRKLRLKRKSREVEMKAQALQLEKDNRLLKIKAMILRKSMQIFQYEEPFINDVNSPCTVISDKLSSHIDIHRDDMVAAEEVVKSQDTCAVIVAPIRQLVQPFTIPLPTVFVKSEPTLVSKMPEETPKPAVLCPKLKLDIEAANMTSQTETMDTPEVQQPLTEEMKGFSLLSYVSDDEPKMLSTITGSLTNQMTCLTIPPQNRGSETKMPLNRYNITKTGKRKHHGQPSTSVVTNRPKRKSTENIKLVVSKKHLSDTDDLESLNSVDTNIVSDSNESLSAKSKCTNKSNGRKRKLSLVDSDLESINSMSNRYRESRDRNNEVLPTKSKLNRKFREVGIKEQTVQLEKDNRLLKIKAAILQRLIQIFLSEEPFINYVDSSCTVIPDKLSPPIDIRRDDRVAAEEVVKSQDTCAVTVEPIRQMEQPPTISLPTVFVKPKPTPVFKIPEEIPKPADVRPKMKLDIEAANMVPQTETMDTPEVQQPLIEEMKGFSLLSYASDDEANVLSKITGNPSNQMTCLTIPPQKRGSETMLPLSRYNATKIARRKHQYKTLEENIGQPSTLLVTNRAKRKCVENLKPVVSKKRLLTVDSDDLESLNSVDTSIVSDSYKSFCKKSKTNRIKRTNKNNAGRKRKVSLVDSDLDSVSSTSDRYRELRDKNNEASRKSRLNKKFKEVEMKAQVEKLEKYNRLLKMKAAKMVRLVKKLRESFNVNH